MVMGMGNKCENCTEKCPQAEMAHQAALGRMYATKEFTTLLKKVENGELVEVVRCKDCKYAENMLPLENGCGHLMGDCTVRKEDEIVVMVWGNDFCSYGERKDNARKTD
jgi:hypothetical protein